MLDDVSSSIRAATFLRAFPEETGRELSPDNGWFSISSSLPFDFRPVAFEVVAPSLNGLNRHWLRGAVMFPPA